MGGTGSGRWAYHEKKLTVEECWAIDVSDVVWTVETSKPRPTSGSLRTIKPARDRRTSTVRCLPLGGDDGTPLLQLSYKIGDRGGTEHCVEQALRLQTTRPNFGGVRWWFSCPRAVDGEECGRRVGKLYRPPKGRHFACRHCLDLTYESCQKSHRYDGLIALLAGEASGEAFETVKRVFRYRAKEAKRRVAERPPMLPDGSWAESVELLKPPPHPRGPQRRRPSRPLQGR